MYEQLSTLDSLKITPPEGGLLNIVLALVMYGVALGVVPSRFKHIFTKPKSILLGLFGQWVLLPALTYLLVICLHGYITPMVALGMILVASCPGGNISNFMTSLAKGNNELSISMTAVTTTCAPIITPLNFTFWGNLYVNFFMKRGLDIPYLRIPFSEIVITVLLLLGIPLVLGLLTSHYLPKVTEKIKKPIKITSVIIFVAMIVVAFIGNLNQFGSFEHSIAIGGKHYNPDAYAYLSLIPIGCSEKVEGQKVFDLYIRNLKQEEKEAIAHQRFIEKEQLACQKLELQLQIETNQAMIEKYRIDSAISQSSDKETPGFSLAGLIGETFGGGPFMNVLGEVVQLGVCEMLDLFI